MNLKKIRGMLLMYEYSAKLVRVVDADTLELDIDLGFHTTRREKVRVLYAEGSTFDAPETTLRGDTTEEEKARGIAAKEYAVTVLSGLNLRIRTIYDRRGKYGRFLASVTLPDGSDYARVMEEAGHIKATNEEKGEA